MTATSSQPQGEVPGPANQSLSQRLVELRAHLSTRAGLDYTMLRFCVVALVSIGILMAFSSSMATSLAESGTVWSEAMRQMLLVALGLVAFWVGLRIPPDSLRKVVPLALVVAVLLLIAVLIPGIGTGRESVGSQSWIVLGPLTLQPSEFARVVVGLFGASALADKVWNGWKLSNPFLVYAVIAGFMLILIMAQGDIGMAMSFALVVIFTLAFAGVNWRVFIPIAGLGILGAVLLFFSGGFRSHRFHTYFDALRGNIEDTQGAGFQAYQGFLSLADGGFWGVGLGQSRAKWFYLPEAKNDFVYAVIGEELGLWGGALVILLFATLGYVGIRTARRARNQYQALLAATLTVGVVSQAFYNIGYVIGLLPVTGIQLPMISAGGTAAIITIGSMGILCNVARHEPMQVSAMQNFGRPIFDRVLGIPEPRTAPEVIVRGNGRHSRPAASVPNGSSRTASQPRPRGSATHEEGERRRRYGRPVTERGQGRSSYRESTSRRESRGAEAPRVRRDPRIRHRSRGE